MPDLLIKKELPISRSQILYQSAGIIFYSGLGLFLLSLASLGGLTLFNRSQSQTKDELLKEIESKQEELRPELLNQIFTLEARLKNMQIVLSGHQATSNILKFLEENTLSQVRFLNFDLKTDTRRLDMAGEAASYSTLAEEILLLERNPQIEKVEFGGLTLESNNLVNFHLTITFKPSIFRPEVESAANPQP